jgi:hypothetical protein
MRTASTLRTQIEAVLADRIPCALTPAAKTVREVVPTGIATIDAVLDGGLPVGAVTEMIGAECSGRTALALSFMAQFTKAERVCAWIDVSNALSPESAAASGIDLKRLLWVRCGVQPASQPASPSQDDFALPEKYLAPPAPKRGLHGGASARILGLKQRACPMESGTCCDAMRSLLGAPSRNARFGSNERLLSRTPSGPPNATVFQPIQQSPGRGSSRQCVLLICFCRPVDSAQSCWIWEASRLSTSRAYRWRRGFATALLRSGAERASSC